MDRICVPIQLTKTQHASAEEKYLAIGNHLGDSCSPLANMVVRIYPQGSMALGTTVKPRKREEFDLDLILLMLAPCMDPLQLRNAVIRRMLDDSRYSDKLDLTLPRCIRVNYAGQFHLDIVPARMDLIRGGTSIEVPDKDLRRWMPNNPLRYAAWFEVQTKKSILEKAAAQDPLPRPVAANEKPVLKRAVQLWKRHRDVQYDGDGLAPSSIVLTTLAGRFYRGESSVLEALKNAVASTMSEINLAGDGRMTLDNPGNSGECLVGSWNNNRYKAFVKFVGEFQRSLDDLSQQVGRGFQAIGAQLKKMFDEEGHVVDTVVDEFAKSLQEQRKHGLLKATSGGLALGAGRSIPRNVHYGR